MSQIELHEEQGYVHKIAESLGIELKLLRHERPTISCAEKLDLLKENPDFEDWTLDRIVKALYFSRNGLPFIGVITPEFGRNVKQHEIFPKVFGISKTEARKYWANPNFVPEGMSWGTCTPFPLESAVGEETGKISDIIFLDHPPIKEKPVDISVGGATKESYLTSMHIPYTAIYEILKRQFPERVHLYQNITS